MIKFIHSKLSYKIIFYIWLLFTIGMGVIGWFVYKELKDDFTAQKRSSLDNLSISVFHTLRDAMDTGDSQKIQDTKVIISKEIDSIKKLLVYRNKKVIELFPSNNTSTSPLATTVMQTKTTKIIENNLPSHTIAMYKPLVADSSCLTCHVNQQQGDVIGVMELVFTMDDVDVSLNNIMLSLVVIITIIGWIILMILLVIIYRSTKPVGELLNNLDELIDGGNITDKRINIQSQDDIGQIANKFNIYLDTLQNKQTQDSDFIKELGEFITSLSNGNFDVSFETTPKSNDLLIAKKDILKLGKTLYNNFEYLNSVIRDLGDGKFEVEYTKETTGEFEKAKDSINYLSRQLSAILIGITDSINAAISGNLSFRVENNNLFKRDFKDIVDGLNSILERFDNSLTTIAQGIQELSVGNLQAKIDNLNDGEYKK